MEIYTYVTENTFDAYLYQTIENKQKFISQVMTSRTPLRSCEDVDESVLNYAEVKALCIGDPRIKEKMELDIDVNKLKLLEASYKNQQFALQDKPYTMINMRVQDTDLWYFLGIQYTLLIHQHHIHHMFPLDMVYKP